MSPVEGTPIEAPAFGGTQVYSLNEYLLKVRLVQKSLMDGVNLVRAALSLERALIRSGAPASDISDRVNAIYQDIVSEFGEVPAVLEALWNVSPLHQSMVRAGIPESYAKYVFYANHLAGGRALITAWDSASNLCEDDVFSCFQAGDVVTLSGFTDPLNDGDYTVSEVDAVFGSHVYFTGVGAADEADGTTGVLTLKTRP